MANMGESVDVKALRAKFHAEMADSRSRDSVSPKSPLHGIGRGGPLALSGAAANGDVRHKLLPVLPPPLPGSSPSVSHARFPMPPRVESRGSATPRAQLPLGVFPRPPPSHSIRAMEAAQEAPQLPLGVFPRPPPSHSIRAMEAAQEAPQASEPGRVKQTGEMLRTIMKHQGPPTAPQSPLPAQALPSQRSLGEVTPLRRPLPPEDPRLMKPKRPPYVNLEPYQRNYRAPPPKSGRPGFMKNDGSSSSVGSSLSLPGPVRPPGPLKPHNKQSSLPRQLTSVHLEDNQDTYDDIEILEKSDALNDNSMEGASDDSEEYDIIDENQLEINHSRPNKKTQKEMKRQQEQEKKDQKERQKRENELRKRFQLQGEIEVLHLARVRHDWHGGKLDLSVRQGESVEILRVKNNPGGKWLVRTLTGNYGYISNTCVDIDYEEVKRKVLLSRGMVDPALLPPPPPDPPQADDRYYDVDSSDHVDSSTNQEDGDDYDDIQSLPQDFPPPPPEICIYPKIEKEFRKRFKFEGPVRVLHTMMVDPNGSIKKPGGKDLAVAQGEILDVIQLTNDKKALCRNQYGKYGYVSRALLLQMEGDVYDDVDHFNDIYDNDPTH